MPLSPKPSRPSCILSDRHPRRPSPPLATLASRLHPSPLVASRLHPPPPVAAPRLPHPAIMAPMEDLLLDIVAQLRTWDDASSERAHAEGLGVDAMVERCVRRHNRGKANNAQHFSKRHLLPFYLRVREQEPERWRSWDIDPDLEHRLLQALRMKPRRTASGVATITVITRPQPCSSNCVYCPCDLRMPKSYLYSEPACQRAEHNFFDPYLQVALRLRALDQMGHATDKVELIVLGGTWTDYPRAYQIWFVRELFRALNEYPTPEEALRRRYQFYRERGFSNDATELAHFVAGEQARVDAGEETYNQGFSHLYETPRYQEAAAHMTATPEELAYEQHVNETAAHRVVGLVVETRPDAIDPESLTLARRLGCTKIQVGIQSTRQDVLDACQRKTTIAQVKRAFSLIRLFGFKIHSHLMLNLPTATPAQDKDDFANFVTDQGFLPDEIKLYPCSLVAGTQLVRRYKQGLWRPYTEDELMDVLCADVLATPPYVRISRMIRDIGADDILVGNKKANLRQMVETRINRQGQAGQVEDMRFREIARSEVDLNSLRLADYTYRTSTTTEHFLQWVTPENRIAGFLRLSLPDWDGLSAGLLDVAADELPVQPGDAMIREVHVYGQAAHLGREDSSSQHQGLGTKLVHEAFRIAGVEGYESVNVISSVGTREWYRQLGFEDVGLYQKALLSR